MTPGVSTLETAETSYSKGTQLQSSAMPSTPDSTNATLPEISITTIAPTSTLTKITTTTITSTANALSTIEEISSTTASTTVSTTPSTTTSEKITTTFSTTEKTEEILNYPPRQDKRLQKLPVIAGKPLSYFIPNDTFIDHEDGNTRQLKLDLLFANGEPIRRSHWLQFNKLTQQVYGL